MSALLYDPAIFEQQDNVRVSDCAETMSDDDLAAVERRQVSADAFFRHGVQMAGSFV
jgi:hypothetical protein